MVCVVALKEGNRLPTQSTIDDSKGNIVCRHDLVRHDQSPLSNVADVIKTQRAVALRYHPGGCEARPGEARSQYQESG